MMKSVSVFCLNVIFAFLSVMVYAEELNLLPRPQRITMTSGRFDVGEIAVSSPVQMELLGSFIEECGGKVRKDASLKLEVHLVDKIDGVLLNQHEAYRLTVSRKKIQIEAADGTRCLLGCSDFASASYRGKEIVFPCLYGN